MLDRMCSYKYNTDEAFSFCVLNYGYWGSLLVSRNIHICCNCMAFLGNLVIWCFLKSRVLENVFWQLVHWWGFSCLCTRWYLLKLLGTENVLSHCLRRNILISSWIFPCCVKAFFPLGWLITNLKSITINRRPLLFNNHIFSNYSIFITIFHCVLQ